MPPRKKPATSPKRNGTLLSFFGRGASSLPPSGSPAAERKGKRKADVGSAADPVVISDEEDMPRKQVRRVDPGSSRSGSSGEETQPTDLDSVEPQGDGPSHRRERNTDDTDEQDEAEEVLATECMMCGARLPRDPTSAEAHVNACLDADSRPKKGPPKDPPQKPKQKKAKVASPEIVILSPDHEPPPAPKGAPDTKASGREPNERANGRPPDSDSDARKERDVTPRPITSISHSFRTDPEPPADGKANAFSVLMSSHKEKETWDEVDEPKVVPGRRRAAPFYKILTGMPISVDAFCYGAIPGVTAYFLTHAHSDHYTNLSKSWRHGPIYCSETTANLVVLMLGLEPQWVHGIPNDVPYTIPNTGGVTVTLIEANHCPGSSIFLFEGRQTAHAGDSSFRSPYVGSKRTFRYLHCGDFRACPKHVLHPAVARAPLDTIYLDTTYLNPQYCFPPQPLVIQACAELAKKVACDDVDIKPKIEEAELAGDEELEAEMPGDLEMLPPEEEDIKPDIGDDYDEGVKPDIMDDEEEDIKPDLEDVCPEEAEETEALEELDSGSMLPVGVEEKAPKDEDGEHDLKPDMRSDAQHEAQTDVKPDITSDIKPTVDTKPDIKPHPASVAYDILERSVNLMEGWLNKHPGKEGQQPKPRGRVLVLVGTYTIGKERIVKAIARALDSKIYCDERKRGIINAQADPELHAMIGDDPRECQVHIVPLWNIQAERLQPYLQTLAPAFERVLAFRPTGWTYRAPAGANTLPDVNFVIKRDQAQGFSDVSLRPIRGSSRQFMMFGVPYSEHSSFFELTCFSLSVPGTPKIIATVNVHNERSRQKMRKWFEKWAAEKTRRRERGDPALVGYRDEDYW